MSPRSPVVPAPGNVLAAVLTRHDADRVVPSIPLSVVEIDGPAAIGGKDAQDVLFPVTALLGLISVLPDGAEVEVASVGWEGVVGYPPAPENDVRGSRLLCHVPGRVLQMRLPALLRRLDDDRVSRSVFEHHAAMSTALLAQRAACGQRHAASGRYATWLLTASDRLGPHTHIPLTQHMLAVTLGLQRTTVSTIAAGFEQQGITATRYGAVEILDRAGLKTAACACYPRYRRHVKAFLAHAREAVAIA